MSAILKSTSEKSTTVRSKCCPTHLAWRSRHAPGSATARDDPPDKLIVFPATQPAKGRPTRFERLIVPALVAIVACYAAAVMVRVVLAYGA